MTKTIALSADMIDTAFTRWERIHPTDSYEALSRYLQTADEGFIAHYWASDDSWHVNEETARRFTLLLGPYYAAVIKVWMVQQDMEAGDINGL